eukprot:1661520-Prymnesium_polylepis.1
MPVTKLSNILDTPDKDKMRALFLLPALRPSLPTRLLLPVMQWGGGMGPMGPMGPGGMEPMGPMGPGGGMGPPFGPDNYHTVQGSSRRTWSYGPMDQMVVGTEGRPLNADIELWNGPDNTPARMRVYEENGAARPMPFSFGGAGAPGMMSVRNSGPLEFPIAAGMGPNNMAARGGGFGGGPVAADRASFKTVQGGALRTFHFDHAVDSVQVILTTEGRPLEAKVELLQGPNNVKKAIDLYTEDGYRRQFSCVLETPGDSYVVQITNTAPIEFPISASVVPLSIGRGGMSPYNNQWGYGRGQGGMSPYNDQWGYGRGGR